MAKLSTKQRKMLPMAIFAGPNRSFPLTDPGHERAAISGATRSMHAGNITASQAARIKAKARAKLKNGK